jgi:hypothetical protein
MESNWINGKYFDVLYLRVFSCVTFVQAHIINIPDYISGLHVATIV